MEPWETIVIFATAMVNMFIGYSIGKASMKAEIEALKEDQEEHKKVQSEPVFEEDIRQILLSRRD